MTLLGHHTPTHTGADEGPPGGPASPPRAPPSHTTRAGSGAILSLPRSLALAVGPWGLVQEGGRRGGGGGQRTPRPMTYCVVHNLPPSPMLSYSPGYVCGGTANNLSHFSLVAWGPEKGKAPPPMASRAMRFAARLGAPLAQATPIRRLLDAERKRRRKKKHHPSSKERRKGTKKRSP